MMLSVMISMMRIFMVFNYWLDVTGILCPDLVVATATVEDIGMLVVKTCSAAAYIDLIFITPVFSQQLEISDLFLILGCPGKFKSPNLGIDFFIEELQLLVCKRDTTEDLVISVASVDDSRVGTVTDVNHIIAIQSVPVVVGVTSVARPGIVVV